MLSGAGQLNILRLAVKINVHITIIAFLKGSRSFSSVSMRDYYVIASEEFVLLLEEDFEDELEGVAVWLLIMV
jgi:hypothetical protein